MSAALSVIADSIQKMRNFVEQVYLPDLLAIAPYYLDYAAIGEGLGNFLTWGEFPEGNLNELDRLIFPRGVIINRNLKRGDHTRPARCG